MWDCFCTLQVISNCMNSCWHLPPDSGLLQLPAVVSRLLVCVQGDLVPRHAAAWPSGGTRGTRGTTSVPTPVASSRAEPYLWHPVLKLCTEAEAPLLCLLVDPQNGPPEPIWTQKSNNWFPHTGWAGVVFRWHHSIFEWALKKPPRFFYT